MKSETDKGDDINFDKLSTNWWTAFDINGFEQNESFDLLRLQQWGL